MEGECIHIRRLTEGSMSYGNFYWEFIKTNTPVIVTGVSIKWECSNWLLKHGQENNIYSSEINFDYLKQQIGDRLVVVTKCSTHDESTVSVEMQFHEFLNYWRNQILSSKADVNNVTAPKILYLKDWHLKAQLPNYEFYKVPQYFASDWLNEYLEEHKLDDYRFVYMGPKNSWTPLHIDVFGSYSWSTNIYGRKKWILLPPGEQFKLLGPRGSLPCNIKEEMLIEKSVNFLIIYQHENETLFVPSGWYHQVLNVTDTISVNHNWFNGTNIKYIWCNITENLRKVMNEILEFRQYVNFKEDCQQILKCNFGLNISDFLEILCFIANSRLTLYMKRYRSKDMSGNRKSVNSHPDNFHIHYDLKSINMLSKFIAQDKIVFNCSTLYDRCMNLIDITQEIFLER
ncbi:2-oxoglutarate and iron-dependent oxygenase JMJD4 homolog [Eurosta solidaginis]|uniref:2-oxoglutarate and iron-dependent oxygenase JMJD4 homolog n=1 Tax=Eurosta solidaginis TaxID=178769 RepID=UPI0035306964